LRFIPEFLLANHDFPLQGEFIELNVLLKLLGLASSGGAAKALIAEGAVRVGSANRNPHPPQVARG